MRCAAHTLQLAIQDGIHHSRAGGVLGRIREVAKEARKPTMMEIIKQRTNKVALLDMETRWGSTYCMLNRIIDLRAIVDEYATCGRNDDLKMTVYQWQQAIQLRDLLKKAFEVTKKLQYADISPGYFYRKWDGLRLFYDLHGSVLGEEIAKAMKKREADLFGSGVLLAAVHLDVRNRELLPEVSVQKAREVILNLVLRQQGMALQEDSEDSRREEAGSANGSGADDSDSDDEIRLLRRQQRSSRLLTGISYFCITSLFELLLILFCISNFSL